MVSIIAGIALAVGIILVFPPANPDPNHTHADFAIWVNGSYLDFSGDEYMSGSSTDGSTHPTEGLRKYLHLHDGNGSVIHRHKSGLTLNEFLASNLQLNLAYSGSSSCFYTPADGCTSSPLHMFVNGKEFLDSQYPGRIGEFVFQDGDHILITDSQDASVIAEQLQKMTDDACQYSRTCPWRGAPPMENCIADPTVPCML